MTYLYVSAALVVTFVAGKLYGARVEKAAVDAALYAFAEAKYALIGVVTKAQAAAKAEVERLESIAKKYV